MSDDLVARANEWATDREQMLDGDADDGCRLVWELADEIERLTALIDAAAKHWLSLEPGVPWEGAIDAAMEAAVKEIERLRGLRCQDSDNCALCAEHVAEIERLRGERAANLDPDFLGQVVRMAWVEWASEQAEPKFSWLVPWDYLAEPDREADRRIGKAVAKVCVTPELLKVEAENRALRERLEKAADLKALIDEGFLVRSIEGDAEQGWALKILPKLQRLAEALRAIEEKP